MIGRMYRRELQWDEQKLEPAQRLEERLKPGGLVRTMASLKRLALWTRKRVLPKSALGRACDYLLSQYEALVQHLRFGQTGLNNNLVENAIDPRASAQRTGCLSATPRPANVPRSSTR